MSEKLDLGAPSPGLPWRNARWLVLPERRRWGGGTLWLLFATAWPRTTRPTQEPMKCSCLPGRAPRGTILQLESGPSLLTPASPSLNYSGNSPR